MSENIPAVILAGGQSRRMGGAAKFRIRIGGMTLLEHVIARLRPQTGEILLNLNDPAATDFDPAIAIRPDGIGGYLGPLAGILTGLDYYLQQGSPARHMLSAPIDTPFLPADLTCRLMEAAAKSPDAIIMARSSGRVHPVIALWPLSLRDDLHDALVAGEIRKVRDFILRHPSREVEWMAERGKDPFFNINRPEDIETARARLQLSPP